LNQFFQFVRLAVQEKQAAIRPRVDSSRGFDLPEPSPIPSSLGHFASGQVDVGTQMKGLGIARVDFQGALGQALGVLDLEFLQGGDAFAD